MKTEIYCENDYLKVKNQRKNCLTLFYIISAVFLVLSIGLLVWFCLEPYGTKNRTWMIVLECVITGLYVVYAYIFLTVTFSRVNKYCKNLKNILTKKPTVSTCNFMRFNNEITKRNGIDVKTLTLVEWSSKKKEYMERNVFIDLEKPLPVFRAGDEIEITTYSNILTAYKFLNRTAEGTPFDSKE